MRKTTFAMLVLIACALIAVLCSCQKEEYYHHNDVPVSWRYDSTGIDTLEIDIDGAGGWDMTSGYYRLRETSETINTWYGQKYHIFAIHNHRLTLKFEGITLMENVIYADTVISK